MSNINVLQICSYYINDKFYKVFFEKLSKKGYNSIPYVFANKNLKNKKHIPNVDVSFCFNSIERMFFHIKHKKVINDCMNKLNISDYNFIHAHSLFSNGYIAYRLNKKYGLPYIVTVRYPDVLTFFKYMINLRGLGIHILLNAESVVFLSESYYKQTLEYIPEQLKYEIRNKSYIIPNGIDDFWLNNKPVNHKLPNTNEINLLFVGRINKNKNIEILTNICKTLVGKGVKVSLTIAGGIENSRYLKYFDKYDFINYLGNCNKEKLLECYRKADIFILLSHKETFGLVYAEAMSQGLPVIYTRNQGFYGQFEEGIVGFGVSDKHPAEAEEAIYKIIGNYEEISQNCLRHSAVFSWDAICSELKEIYSKLM